MVGGDAVGRSSAVRIVDLLTPADLGVLAVAGDEDVQVDGAAEGERGEDRQEADDGVAEPEPAVGAGKVVEADGVQGVRPDARGSRSGEERPGVGAGGPGASRRTSRARTP